MGLAADSASPQNCSTLALFPQGEGAFYPFSPCSRFEEPLSSHCLGPGGELFAVDESPGPAMHCVARHGIVMLR